VPLLVPITPSLALLLSFVLLHNGRPPSGPFLSLFHYLMLRVDFLIGRQLIGLYSEPEDGIEIRSRRNIFSLFVPDGFGSE
jgi:hypothetical protein